MPVLLRPARPEDADEVARLHVRSWQVGYRGLLPETFLAGLRPEQRASRYTFGSPDPGQPATILALGQHTRRSLLPRRRLAPRRRPPDRGGLGHDDR